MDFLEACEALRKGHRIRKANWSSDEYIFLENGVIITNLGSYWTDLFLGLCNSDNEWEFYRDHLQVVLDEQVILKKGDEDIVLGEISDLEVIKQELISSLNRVNELTLNGEQIARNATDNNPVYSSVWSPDIDKLDRPIESESESSQTSEPESFFFTDKNGDTCKAEVGKTYRFLYLEQGVIEVYAQREATVTGSHGSIRDLAVLKIYANITPNDTKFHNQKSKGRTFHEDKIINWEEVDE